jgi:hypothetical protein
MREPRDRFLMSQLPPCSRGGTVRHASFAALCDLRPVICPISAVSALGGAASGGTRLGLVAMSSASRLLARSSSSWFGRQPIRPGCTMPAQRTPGTWREVV